MKHRSYHGSQFHKMRRRAVMGFFISLFFVCLSFGVLVAKYYAGNSDKGVATASGLYFTSNLLKDVQDAQPESYPVVYNTEAWDGTDTYTFKLEIRNYQNQLLYNDKNINITYRIGFSLTGATDGASYHVTYLNENKEIRAGEECTFEATLEGGYAKSDLFEITVKRPEGDTNENYRSVGIRVCATPISPSYVKNAARLGGVLYAQIKSAQFELKGEFSKVPADRIGSEAAFPYTVTYKPDAQSGVIRIRISWNPKLLQLDQFSPYYALIQTDADDNTKQCIELDIDPYSSIDILFYRTGSFDNTISWEKLQKSVSIMKKEM